MGIVWSWTEGERIHEPCPVLRPLLKKDTRSCGTWGCSGCRNIMFPMPVSHSWILLGVWGLVVGWNAHLMLFWSHSLREAWVDLLDGLYQKAAQYLLEARALFCAKGRSCWLAHASSSLTHAVLLIAPAWWFSVLFPGPCSYWWILSKHARSVTVQV